MLKAKSFNSTMQTTNTKMLDRTISTKKSFMLSDDITPTHTRTFGRELHSKFNTETRGTGSVRANAEKARMFDRITQKEKRIEEFNIEKHEARKMFQQIKFENHVHEKKGKGEFYGMTGVNEEFKPTKRILTGVRAALSPEDVIKKARKPAPAESMPLRRDPICTGEEGKLIVPRDREFKASVHSQVITFKRLFLPSEWRAEMHGTTPGPNQRAPSNMKSLLSYEYANKGF